MVRSKEEIINDLDILVSKKGGKILSKYINYSNKILVRCNNEHEWEISPDKLFYGRWCPFCAGIVRLTIDEMKKIAIDRNGRCLSDKYTNARDNLLWECQRKHTWSATPDSIKRGSWCPHCNIYVGEEICRRYLETIFNEKFPKIRPIWLRSPKNYPMELDGFCKKLNIAFEHNGSFHYGDNYFASSTTDGYESILEHDKLKIELTNAHDIKLIVIPQIHKIVNLENLKEYIKNECMRLNILLPSNFNDIRISTSNIYNDNIVEKYKNIANNKGGELIIETFISTAEKATWKCSKNHTWDATPGSINNGCWCPICSSKKLSIDIAKEIAISKNGECLSLEYINSKKKLEWRCNHCLTIWKASLHNISVGETWCPKCAGCYRPTIDYIRDFAKSKNGECLSEVYINNHSPLIWKCDQGHEWENSFRHIKNGYWCRKCKYNTKGA